MGTTFILSGLSAKRAELAGQIVVLERQIGQIWADLHHIDAVLRLYGLEALESVPAKRAKKRNDWFRPGECAELVLDILRKANHAALPTREITERITVAKGMLIEDARTRDLFQRTILGALNRMKGVQRISDGSVIRWRIAED